MSRATPFLVGLVFGLGLCLSGMTDPAKVLGFLDVLGAWDPSLAVVMAAALIVTRIGIAIVQRRGQPFLPGKCDWPTKTKIDPPLVFGSMLFGVGWGLVGLCPGPALVNLATLSPQVLVFVVAMLTGMALHDLWQRRLAAGTGARSVMPIEVDG